MAQINQSKFSTYILVILILAVTTFVFANCIEANMLNPSIAYGKNKVFSKSITYTIAANNLEQPSSLVTQLSTSDTDQASFKNIAFPSTTQSTNLTEIFKKVENSVVQITAKTANPNLQIIINGIPLSNKSTRLGSGFVYDKQGHIITNTHVIDGASIADVTFVDGNTYRAKVIGKDPSGDIAVLQITDDFSPENLVPAPIVN
ncbi:MAG TPA: S1C family serine protease, partial [Candidatus Bathyarchaeia archaeon]|nr:S1C family serine protease [Candidatus Bathyarchaeia archaeon]